MGGHIFDRRGIVSSFLESSSVEFYPLFCANFAKPKRAQTKEKHFKKGVKCWWLYFRIKLWPSEKFVNSKHRNFSSRTYLTFTQSLCILDVWRIWKKKRDSMTWHFVTKSLDPTIWRSVDQWFGFPNSSSLARILRYRGGTLIVKNGDFGEWY